MLFPKQLVTAWGSGGPNLLSEGNGIGVTPYLCSRGSPTSSYIMKARFWLKSEKLREFPAIASFTNRESPACRLIESALVWSRDAAGLFPVSCRRRARELLLIPWPFRCSLVTEGLLPFAIDRCGVVEPRVLSR